jgi:hypothetical protein
VSCEYSSRLPSSVKEQESDELIPGEFKERTINAPNVILTTTDAPRLGRMADSYGHNAGSPESSPHSDNESGGHYRDHDASVREQDRFLPIANVSRIMKKALPSNAKISKDAKETVQECVSEFISFITGTPSI